MLTKRGQIGADEVAKARLEGFLAQAEALRAGDQTPEL